MRNGVVVIARSRRLRGNPWIASSGYAFLAMTTLIAGCTSMGSNQVPCPKTAILAEFSKTIDVSHKNPIRTELDSLVPICSQEGDRLCISFKLRMTSFRSLKESEGSQRVRPSYFVAVIDKEGNILSRTNHDIDIVFDEKQTTKVVFENLQEWVPEDQDITLYVGFNLDPEVMKLLKQMREEKLKPHAGTR